MNIDQLSNLFLREEKNIDNLYTLIKKYNIELLLPQILQNLEKKQRLVHERKKVILESPLPLSPEVQKSIEEKYGEKVEEVKIDKSLVLGFKLKTRDKVIDSSLQALVKNFIK